MDGPRPSVNERSRKTFGRGGLAAPRLSRPSRVLCRRLQTSVPPGGVKSLGPVGQRPVPQLARHTREIVMGGVGIRYPVRAVPRGRPVANASALATPEVDRSQGEENLDLELQLLGDLPREPRHLTGMGNAERLVDQHSLDIRYAHASQRWILWDGQRFREDETDGIMRLAKETVASIYAEAAEEQDTDRRKAIAAWAARSESEGHLREMVSLAECELPIRVEQLDANPWYLTVGNGTVNLRTGELYPHSRLDFTTKLAPVPYDKEAGCPTWLGFLDRIFAGDAELIAFLQRAIGYSLTGESNEQVLFFLYGTGSNGKSTLIEALRALVGEYGQQAPMSTFLERRGEGPSNDIARLRGKRFVSSIEAGEGHRLNESLVKQVTGGDTITARFLHREFFEFRPQFKLWLAANHKPVIRGTDHAIWRRIRLIPFTITIPEDERDPELPTKLRKELPGILRWAVDGCLLWQRVGLGAPPAVREATDAYRCEMDVLAGFLDDRCELGQALTVEAGALYQAYCAWCEANGERPASQRAFGLRLKDRTFQQARTGQARRWTGLRLTDMTDHDAGSGILSSNSPRVEKTQKAASPSVTPVMLEPRSSRPICAVHGPTQRRRRDGTWRCPECIPNNPANPYTADHFDPTGSVLR